MRLRGLFVSCAFLVLTACSGGGRQALPPAGSGGYPVLSASSIVLPTSANLTVASGVKAATGANIDTASDAFRFRRAAGAGISTMRAPQSNVGGNLNAGHGQDGYFIQAPLDADHSAVIMFHSVWVPGSDVILNQPPVGGNTYYLYAPTTHPPNSCIEAGTAYENSPAPAQNVTRSYVYFYDFCKNGGSFAWFPNDAAFRSQYAFESADGGALSIAIAVGTFSSSLSAPDWSAYVWNVHTRHWDFFYASPYASRTASPPTVGWSIFEPNFQSQPSAQSCKQPRTPAFTADDLRFYNIQSEHTSYIDDSAASRTTQGACVTADATGPASFSFAQEASDWHWRETATGQ
jgi:hypothetical protein